MSNKKARRNFIKTIGVLPLCISLNANPLENKHKWDEEVDVLVVGGGLAGLVASIYCAEKNLKTLMLERNSAIGGSSKLSTLEMAIANSPMQQNANIQDSPMQMAEDMSKAGYRLNDYRHSLNIAEKSSSALSFIIERGARFGAKIKLQEGHSNARTISPKENGSKSIIKPLFEHLKSLPSFSLHANTKAFEIIKNSQNEAIGLKATKKTKKGYTTCRYKARKGIVFASGGYSQDKEFRTIQNPLVRHIGSSTNKQANADSLKCLLRAGATPVQLALMRFAFSTSLDIMQYGCMINSKTSLRFVNENSERQDLANKILFNMQKTKTKRYPIIIFDTIGVNSFPNSNLLKAYFKQKIIHKHDSLKQLSLACKINLNKLQRQLNLYNKYIRYGNDRAFNKKITKYINTIEKAPYYSMQIIPKLNYTQGGIRIDTKARVIHIQTNKPIKNLYAAGEVTGGIHGYSRLISCSTPDCLVYALSAAKEICKT